MEKVKNVILISLDCLRAESLPMYGYEKNTAPFMKELAGGAISFNRSYATSNWTAPTHASMFTGLYPHQHGFINFYSNLNDGVLPLAEALVQQGVKTTSITSWHCFSQKSGMMRGFEDCRVVPGQHVKEIALTQMDWTRDWLKENSTGKPFFLFLHFGQIHAPFNLCPGQADDPMSEPVKSEIRPLWEVPPPGGPVFNTIQWLENHINRTTRAGRIANRFLKLARGLCVRSLRQVVHKVAKGRLTASEEEMKFLMQRYDQCITYVDERLRDLFETMTSLGMEKDTAVIIVADHGEELFDHGQLFHGHSMYQELIHIPMILSLPESMKPSSNECDAPVDQRDISATVLDLMGAPLDTREHVGGGTSLYKIAREPERHGDRLIYSESIKDHGWVSAVMLQGNNKVQWNAEGDNVVYYPLDSNLQTSVDGIDPEGDAQELAEKLQKFVALQRQDPGATEAADDDPELRKQLEDLGYL